MILEEITFGKTEEEKRKTIHDNLGQQVILKDIHHDWCHGVLLKERHDSATYQIKMIDARRKKSLDYRDLKQLLIIHYNSCYKRPEID
ncbi:MAG: hypothetical protein KJ646_05255 [Nanoarchaeota archaeon]|nr:hypothetical protein [Nanoarchaeota archaeon]MBU4116981.1 hypothetical protein [Nanoarchaeota archaeon]